MIAVRWNDVCEKIVMCDTSVSMMARVILDYLRRNPDAQDTLSGIVEWWLPDDRAKPRTLAIKEALEELVSAGLVIEHEGKDSQISYRMTDHGLRELERQILKEEG